MEGLLILHHPQGSADSTDSAHLPPTYSRLPPDGHEFPEGASLMLYNAEGRKSICRRCSQFCSSLADCSVPVPFVSFFINRLLHNLSIQCCESGCFFRIQDPFLHSGSRIPYPTRKKRGGGGRFLCPTFFVDINFTKLKFFLKENFFRQVTKNFKYFNLKFCTKLSVIWVWVWDPRSGKS